jgi:hypothetical protein
MTWRDVQLGSNLCDQDRLILDLVQERSVRIHGDNTGFDRFCNIDPQSDFGLIFFNRSLWLSEIRQQLRDFSAKNIKCLYVGINRYQIKGNDTSYSSKNQNDTPGVELLCWLEHCLAEIGFSVKKKGFFDEDRGRFYNFVQPLTWLYAEYATNSNH